MKSKHMLLVLLRVTLQKILFLLILQIFTLERNPANMFALLLEITDRLRSCWMKMLLGKRWNLRRVIRTIG